MKGTLKVPITERLDNILLATVSSVHVDLFHQLNEH